MKRHAQKSPCPVSKNFYASVTNRVRESLGLIGRTDAVEKTIACIDRYMADGTAPTAGTDTAILLTFSLLRPEIDKALQRSRRARQRAAENKAAADRQFSELAAILAASVTENHEADNTPLTLMERRLIRKTRNPYRSCHATAANAVSTSRNYAAQPAARTAASHSSNTPARSRGHLHRRC